MCLSQISYVLSVTQIIWQKATGFYVFDLNKLWCVTQIVWQKAKDIYIWVAFFLSHVSYVVYVAHMWQKAIVVYVLLFAPCKLCCVCNADCATKGQRLVRVVHSLGADRWPRPVAAHTLPHSPGRCQGVLQSLQAKDWQWLEPPRKVKWLEQGCILLLFFCPHFQFRVLNTWWDFTHATVQYQVTFFFFFFFFSSHCHTMWEKCTAS